MMKKKFIAIFLCLLLTNLQSTYANSDDSFGLLFNLSLSSTSPYYILMGSSIVKATLHNYSYGDQSKHGIYTILFASQNRPIVSQGLNEFYVSKSKIQNIARKSSSSETYLEITFQGEKPVWIRVYKCPASAMKFQSGASGIWLFLTECTLKEV